MPERPRLALPAVAVLAVGCTVLVPVPSAEEGTPTPSASAAATPTAVPGAATASAASASSGTVPSGASEAPAAFDLEVVGCSGGVVLDWTPLRDPAFHHYIALRSPLQEIDPSWPPIAPAVDWGDTYITDAFVTSAVDASIIPSSTRWFYRVMAYDAAGRVLASSPVRATRMDQRDSLDGVAVTTLAGGETRVSWTPFDGFSACFSAYRVLASTGQGVGSVIGVIADQSISALDTDALHPGVTYTISVEAVRTATRGSFLVGEAIPATYTVPLPATASPP